MVEEGRVPSSMADGGEVQGRPVTPAPALFRMSLLAGSEQPGPEPLNSNEPNADGTIGLRMYPFGS